MAQDLSLVGLDDVLAAAERVRGTCLRTPLLSAGWAGAGACWLKPESLQPTGAFKLRGATNAVARLTAQQRERGVVTHSSGNHGSALAYAAQRAGVPATVVVPHGAPAVKVAMVEAAGATLVRVEAAERVSACRAVAERTGAVEIPPYDHPDVIAGQGTVGLEIAAELPDVQTVLVPVGGGGLISGVAVALRALVPDVRIVGCEPALAADAAASMAAGRRVALPLADTQRTIADGLRAPSLGEITWPHVRDLVDSIVTVQESEICAAVRALATSSRLVVEPSGAVAAAALLSDASRLPGGRTVVVLSGGNVDPGWFSRTLAGSTL
jgi:threonine dehydratase